MNSATNLIPARGQRRSFLAFRAATGVRWPDAAGYFAAFMVVLTLMLSACSMPAARQSAVGMTHQEPPVTVYLIRRKWHTDIGFAVIDLPPSLGSLSPRPVGTRYVLFGFGDEHYLLRHGKGASMLAALWPGPGIMLVTNLKNTPEEAFGNAGVMRLKLNSDQSDRLKAFIWATLSTVGANATLRAAGPYEGSFYYNSTARYSGLYTCNTWTADALQSAGLPVHHFGVEFSSQVWRQARALSDAPQGHIVQH